MSRHWKNKTNQEIKNHFTEIYMDMGHGINTAYKMASRDAKRIHCAHKKWGDSKGRLNDEGFEIHPDLLICADCGSVRHKRDCIGVEYESD